MQNRKKKCSENGYCTFETKTLQTSCGSKAYLDKLNRLHDLYILDETAFLECASDVLRKPVRTFSKKKIRKVLEITRNKLVLTRSQLVITRNQLVVTRSQLVLLRN